MGASIVGLTPRSRASPQFSASHRLCCCHRLGRHSTASMDPPEPIQEWNQYPDLLGDVGLGSLSFQDSVLDNPPIPTRAGLYVYLDSMLRGRPVFDDSAVIDFLNSRYKQDISSLIADLILASLDVLANAINRNEPSRSINLLRSFLVNKLPVFIHNNYAAMIFEPLTVEHCIRQALARVDPAAFPSFSEMFDPLNSLLSEARQEFLFACALHQLIPEQSIGDILGDVPMQSLPAGGKYSKDSLVQQCTSNPAKIDDYISELENMEGNAGEIAAAITQILHTLCVNNDTMTLKAICNSICRRPTTLDITILFTRPSLLLQPLCNILDNWQEHEDQGEHQPVYDEFGAILLLVVMVQHRIKLHPGDFGTSNSGSFLHKYFERGAVSQSLDDLTDHQSQILGNWIKGLFEGEGISDELMSTCNPRDFHLLVATLFDQSLKACQAQLLALETLKGGFEYLLEPFLLPSLAVGLTWFINELWKVHEESKKVNTLLPALQALLKPPSMPHDSQYTHEAVLSVIAKPLSDALGHVQKHFPSRPDISPLLKILETYTKDQRQGSIAIKDLNSWSATPDGSMLAALRQTLQTLILWGVTSTSSTDTSPPSYTHCQLLDTTRILGAQAVLNTLIDEVNETANADVALDVIVVMILTASNKTLQPSPAKAQLSLSDVLQIQFSEVEELSRTDPRRASTIVRFHRRVEALSMSKHILASAGDTFMTDAAHGMVDDPSADINNVLGEAEEQIANAQEFLATDNTALLGVA